MQATTRRLVTTHNEEGLARFWMDSEIAPTMVATNDAAFGLIWSTASVPADNMDDTDGGMLDVGTTLKSGSVIRIVDFRPGATSPMHRSHSIDYGIVLSGELTLELDNGEKQIIREGDVIVQRGTNHRWVAHDDAWCRVAFILIQAAPVVIGGTPLEEQMEAIPENARCL